VAVIVRRILRIYRKGKQKKVKNKVEESEESSKDTVSEYWRDMDKMHQKKS
jgi:uncharacterized protein YjbJ (UPF0337 family)